MPGADFDPTDVLDLGRSLPVFGVSVLTFAVRGTHQSEGQFTFANALDDVGAALLWLQGPGGRAFNVDAEHIAIGGHSLGGGIAMAFAVHDSTLRPVVSIAGNDLGEFARRLRADSALAVGLRRGGNPQIAKADGEVRYLNVHESEELDEEPLANWIRQPSELSGWVP